MLKIFIASFVLFTMSDIAQAKIVGEAKFHAEGEGLALDVDGAGAKVEGDLEPGKAVKGTKFSVNLADFKTGIELRDEHLCKALECSKYPIAQFIIGDFQLKDGPLNGELLLHGVKKPVKGWIAKREGSKIKVSGKLLLSDFGIKAPSYKAAQISDSVEVSVEINI